nr:ribonuclease H-like domain, reverse transcriptase, RNA-dependent DNA polymerase [Tanacetum cinerariifolium]
MSIPAHIYPKTISQTDKARSSRVPIPLPDDLYMAVRHVYFSIITDFESKPFADSRETEIPQPLPIVPLPVPPSDNLYLIVSQTHIPATIDTDAIFLAVALLFFWQWYLSSLAVGSCSVSGNSYNWQWECLVHFIPNKSDLSSLVSSTSSNLPRYLFHIGRVGDDDGDGISGISILLAVGTPSTSSGKLYCQWELSSSSGNALKRKHIELEPEIKVPGLECNRSLPEGVLFVNNMVIEEPEYGIFFTDVFEDTDLSFQQQLLAAVVKFCGFRISCLIMEDPDLSFQHKKQTVVATSSTEAEYVAATSCCGQVLLPVVQDRADNLVSAGGCTLPASSYSFLLLEWFLLVVDDHNKVAYLEKGKCWEAYEQILDFLNQSHIMYALTHRPTMVFDSLVKQFCATATVRTLEAGPSDIIATIDATCPDAETTMPVHSTSTTRRRLKKQFTSSVSAHVSETIPTGVRVPAAASTIPTGSSVDAAIHAAAAPSSFIPTAVDKGKAPMVDDSLPADLLSEQECVLKNLHDSQLGEELAKKIHAEQEPEFTREQEELAQKAQAKSVASPTKHVPRMSDQHRRELDVVQLIYTEADWLDLLAKIATNSVLSKQLLGDDVTEENMNERLGMLLLRKQRELAEQSRVKPMTKTQQKDYMRDFVKNNSASVYNQGWTMKKDPAGVPAAPSIPADVSLPGATSSAPVDIPVPAVSIAHAAVSVPAESHIDPPLTAPALGSSEPTVATPPPSSSRHRRKHIAKKQVTPIVDVADAAMIKFSSDSDSDDDPLPDAPYAGWEMVPSRLGSVHAYHNMAGHTKHFTTLREILHMVERTDLQRLLGVVDALYQSKEPDTFALLLWGDLHVLFQSLDDKDALHFWRTLECMLKHGLEVSKLLVRGDLTMAEQLIGFIKAALFNAKSAD